MDNTETTEQKQTVATAKPKSGNDAVGAMVGIAAFVAGLVILFVTFRLAFDMFNVPARETLGDEKDVTELGKTFGHVLLRVGLLLVMSVVGSVIAGQGVRLYLASRSKPQ